MLAQLAQGVAEVLKKYLHQTGSLLRNGNSEGWFAILDECQIVLPLENPMMIGPSSA